MDEIIHVSHQSNNPVIHLSINPVTNQSSIPLPTTLNAVKMRLNLRWLVQAVALILGIYCFKQLFERSKELLFSFSIHVLLLWSSFFLLFAFCFLLLMFTSYLKERGSNSLKNPISFFEKLVSLSRLDNFTERRALAENSRNDKMATADAEVGDDKPDRSA